LIRLRDLDAHRSLAARLETVLNLASGADLKVVQHRLRHASAKTTLDTYGHLWPENWRVHATAVERVMSAHLADSVRTGEVSS